MSDESKALAVTHALVPAAVFAPGGVDTILNKIKAEVAAVDIDIATPAGRRECASLAYKVARSKTALDEMGKELGEDHYRAWKSITAERSKIVKELDALKDDVRRPLTDWENAEKARVEGHEAAIEAIQESPGFYAAENTADDYRLPARFPRGIP
jgi:colicin import membrane protein